MTVKVMRMVNKMADELELLLKQDEMEENQHLKDSSDSVSLKSKNSKFKNAFGRARLFEIRRIVRRIKQLSHKKGTEKQLQKNKRKVTRLETQLEVLKDTNIHTFIQLIDEDGDKKVSNESQESVDDVKQLVISKIQNMVEQEIAKKDSQENSTRTPKRKTSVNSSGKKRDYTTKKNLNKDSVLSTSDVKTSDSEQVENVDNLSMDSVVVGSLMNEKYKTDGKKRKMKRDACDEIEMSDSDLSLDSEHVTNRGILSLDSEHVANHGILSSGSVFVGSLRNSKQNRNGEKRKEKSGNRLGQRKRREQWAKLYGKRAKHLEVENKKKEILNKKTRKMNSKEKSDEVPKKKSKDASVLHPSWEASISKRKQESIVAFQGQKITFDD